jgi:hypothetical protein
MMHTHQADGVSFRSVLPEDIDWKPFPAFPPSARLAVVVGDPTEPGPYTTRVKVPSGVRLMPHRHPEDRVYTVISGVFYIGLGEQLRQREAGGISVRRRDRATGRHPSFPLGKIRRVRHPDIGNRPTRP